jgi:CheY-like chemotaxis protein
MPLDCMNMQKKKILAVDDDEQHLELVRAVLEGEGYEVLTHRSAFGVTGLIQDVSPDLVLLDISMPGLPGDDLALFLRADSRTRQVPIVFHSSYDEESLRASAVGSHVRGYICKGDIADLRRKIFYFLGLHRENETAYRKHLYAVE